MTRTRRVVAWALAVASITVFVVVPFAEPQADVLYAVLFGAATSSFVLVGLLLLGRVAGNRIGSLLLLAGVLLAVAYSLGAFGLAGAAASPPWPGTALSFVLSDSIFVSPLVIALVGIPLVFPDGRLVSPRWRWLVWLAVIATIAQALSVILTPGAEGPTSLPNPLGVGSLAGFAAILGALSSGSSVLGFGGAAASVWVRYRRGDPVERQQLKWLLAVAALAALFFPGLIHHPGRHGRGRLLHPRQPDPLGAADRDRHRDPALSPVRDRSDHQPDDRVRRHHRRAGRRVRVGDPRAPGATRDDHRR